MHDDALIGDLINRLLARRPDLWGVFQSDPLGALEEARIALTDDERAAVERAGQTPAFRRDKTRGEEDALAAALKADLAAARAARAVDYNPFAEVETGAEETVVEESLLAEQRRVRGEADALREQLAEERARQAREREEARRRLGGKG